MSEVRKSCPDCGGIHFETESTGSLLDAEGNTFGTTMHCASCGWSGKPSETVAFATTQKIFGIEEVGDILIRVLAKRAAGPLIQALEFTGISPSPANTQVAGWAELIEEVRNDVLRSVIGAALQAAFDAGSEGHRKAAEMLWRRHPQTAGELYPNNKPDKPSKKAVRRGLDG